MYASTVRFPGYGRETDKNLNRVSAVIAKRKHPVPFRTRKLSSSAPMVLRGRPRGRVGRRRTYPRRGPFPKGRAALFTFCMPGHHPCRDSPTRVTPDRVGCESGGRRWPRIRVAIASELASRAVAVPSPGGAAALAAPGVTPAGVLPGLPARPVRQAHPVPPAPARPRPVHQVLSVHLAHRAPPAPARRVHLARPVPPVLAHPGRQVRSARLMLRVHLAHPVHLAHHVGLTRRVRSARPVPPARSVRLIHRVHPEHHVHPEHLARLARRVREPMLVRPLPPGPAGPTRRCATTRRSIGAPPPRTARVHVLARGRGTTCAAAPTVAGTTVAATTCAATVAGPAGPRLPRGIATAPSSAPTGAGTTCATTVATVADPAVVRPRETATVTMTVEQTARPRGAGRLLTVVTGALRPANPGPTARPVLPTAAHEPLTGQGPTGAKEPARVRARNEAPGTGSAHHRPPVPPVRGGPTPGAHSALVGSSPNSRLGWMSR